jgi:hypothetical protein
MSHVPTDLYLWKLSQLLVVLGWIGVLIASPVLGVVIEGPGK